MAPTHCVSISFLSCRYSIFNRLAAAQVTKRVMSCTLQTAKLTSGSSLIRALEGLWCIIFLKILFILRVIFYTRYYFSTRTSCFQVLCSPVPKSNPSRLFSCRSALKSDVKSTLGRRCSSGGSSYEATEVGRHLSFWENANYFFFLKRNQIRVSLYYVSHNTNRYLHCVYLYTQCRYMTHQEPIRKLRLPVSASAARPF